MLKRMKDAAPDFDEWWSNNYPHAWMRAEDVAREAWNAAMSTHQPKESAAMYNHKAIVLSRYPAAKLTRDADGFCWVRNGDSFTALNDVRQPTPSPARAWKSAAERASASGMAAANDDFKTAVLRCRYPVCKTLNPSGWGWDTSRLNEVIAYHAGVDVPGEGKTND